MKYNELEKKLAEFGCYEVGTGSHPIWFSPVTGKRFMTSNHKSQEVKKGTLNKILKDAGLK
jgi:predicted RNA binding protein YcfA (HicA-like mRNA interferase family)